MQYFKKGYLKCFMDNVKVDINAFIVFVDWLIG